MKVLGIYGASGLGREVLELARSINEQSLQWEKFVFIDDGNVPSVVSRCNVYKYEEAKERFGENLEIVMGIGEPVTRMKLFKRIEEDGILIPTLISPSVHIPKSAKIGKGVIIQTGCFISVDATISNYTFLQPMCAIGHDCYLNEGCIISSYCGVAGAVKIGVCTYLGMGTIVKELITIGDYCIVGMGSIVFKDVPDEMIAIGNPARIVRKNEERKVFGHK